ncbi:MAG: DKNYY domain-containing protein [Prevotella sp.]|nr:DKNYY domain-containing protein [Prevotella sp.]
MHRRLTTFMLTAIAALLTLTACGDGGKYEEKHGSMYYTYWTFSFGTIEEELTGADPATFESVKDWLGRDAQHVWFKSRLAEGADPSTTKADDYPLFHDKRDYYFEGKAIGVKDPQTFRTLKCDRDEMWGVDSQYAYYDSLRIDDSDPATLELICTFEAKDKRHVYYFGKILEDADPATYTTLGEYTVYTKDRTHVWYCGKPVEGADPATFEAESHDEYGMPDAHDKHRKYRDGEPWVPETDD